MSDAAPIQVTILGKPYKIACPPGQEASLRKAAAHLSGKMQEITDAGPVIGIDKVAVFAALNIAHAYLRRDSEVDEFAERIGGKINGLAEQIDAASPEAD